MGLEEESGLKIFLLLLNVLAITASIADPAPGIHVALELPPSNNNPRNSEGAFMPLRDGRIMFAYSRYRGKSRSDNAPADIVARYSSDNGRSWTSNDEMIVRNEGGMNVMSVSLLRLMSGEIALFYLRKNSITNCIPIMRRSFDEGKTWGEPTVCISDEVAYYVLNNDRVIQIKDGRLLFAVSKHCFSDGKFDKGKVLAYSSDDNGKTWRRGKSILEVCDVYGKAMAAQEPGVVELGDGRIMMWMRTNLGCQYVCHSSDRGETWSEPKPSSLASPLSPATIKRLPTGDLVAVWNDHANAPSDVRRRGRRTPLASAISHDDGRSWTHVRNLEDDPVGWFCYVAIQPLDDGTVLLGYCAYKRLAQSRLVKVPTSLFYK